MTNNYENSNTKGYGYRNIMADNIPEYYEIRRYGGNKK